MRPSPVLIALFASLAVRGSAAAAVDGFPLCTVAGDQSAPVVTPDGTGGAIIAWHDQRPAVAVGGVTFAQRVNATGSPLWTTDGVQLSTTGDPGDPGGPVSPAIDGDGAGGAFLAFGGSNSQPRAQWVNAEGIAQWGADGVQLTNASPSMRHLAVVRDVNGAGGAIVVWRQDNGANGTSDVYAQKVNAAGAVQWGGAGVAVAATTMNSETLPVLISDGAGGAIVAWFNGSSGCRVQRINSSGVAQWPQTPLSSVTNNRRPAIVPDGSGGAVIAWAAGATGIFVQRVAADGARQWSPNNTGVQLCVNGNQCSMIGDGAGGATVAWQDFGGSNYNIYAQRVNGSGAPQWAANGVQVCFVQDDQLAPTIVGDGGTGAIVTWYDGRMFSSGDDIYAERINSAGTSQWTANGVPLCTATNDQQVPTITTDGAGGAFVEWQDRRTGTNDIYFHHLLPSGGIAAVEPAGHTASLTSAWPNPFTGQVRLAFALPAAANVRLEVFDVHGRSIRAHAPERLAAGSHALTWDGRSNDGRPAGGGIYFLRATGAGVDITRRVVRLE